VLKLNWGKCQGGVWCGLMRVDLGGGAFAAGGSPALVPAGPRVSSPTDRPVAPQDELDPHLGFERRELDDAVPGKLQRAHPLRRRVLLADHVARRDEIAVVTHLDQRGPPVAELEELHALGARGG